MIPRFATGDGRTIPFSESITADPSEPDARKTNSATERRPLRGSSKVTGEGEEPISERRCWGKLGIIQGPFQAPEDVPQTVGWEESGLLEPEGNVGRLYTGCLLARRSSFFFLVAINESLTSFALRRLGQPKTQTDGRTGTCPSNDQRSPSRPFTFLSHSIGNTSIRRILGDGVRDQEKLQRVSAATRRNRKRRPRGSHRVDPRAFSLPILLTFTRGCSAVARHFRPLGTLGCPVGCTVGHCGNEQS